MAIGCSIARLFQVVAVGFWSVGIATAQDFEPKVFLGAVSAETTTIRMSYRDFSGERNICTAVLIAPDAALTAAHCSCGLPDSYTLEFMPGSEKLADRKLRKQRLLDEPVIIARPTTMDRNYCRSPETIGRDIALVKIRLSSGPEPVSLIDIRHVYKMKARKLTVVGFGFRENRRLPELPYEAPIRIISLFCSTGKIADSECVPFREFSLGYGLSGSRQPASDTCGGDSGGPVMYQAVDGPRYLVGITSRALKGVRQIKTLNCGGGGIYTSVSHVDVLRWLEQNDVVFNYLRTPP